MNILFIDDEKEILELFRAFIETEENDMKIYTFSDPTSALSELKNNDYDVAVSDYLMPEMSGLELLEKVREKYDDIPFIIFTGKGNEEVAKKSLNLGANGYVNKGEVIENKFKKLLKVIKDEYRRKNTASEIRLMMEKTEKLNDISAAMHNCTSEDEILDLIEERYKDIMDYDAFNILRYDGKHFEPVCTSFEEGGLHNLESRILLNVYKNGKTFINNTSNINGPEFDIKTSIEECSKNGKITYFLIPIESYGVLYVEIGAPCKHLYRDIKITELLTSQMGEAIKRIRSEKNLEERGTIIKKLLDTAIKIEKMDGIDEILQLTINTAKDILEFDRCKICKVENDKFKAVAGSREKNEGSKRLSISQGIAGKTFRDNEPYLINDLDKKTIAKIDQYKSLISLPIGDYGVFQAVSTKKEFFDEDDLEMTKLLIEQTKNGIERINYERELRVNQEKYEGVINNAFAGIAISDFYNSLVFVNKAFADILGYEEDEIIGINLLEITDRDKYRKIKRATNSIKNGKSNILETVLYDKEGTPIDVLLSRSPLKDEYENEIGSIDVMVDISERKEAEQRKKFLHSLLRHDLGNKLQIVVGYLSLMREQEENRLLERSYSAAKDSIKLIEKVRKLSEVEKNNVQSVFIDEFINNTIEQVKTIANKRDINIVVETIDEKVKGGELLEEVFYNLISNSIRHSDCDEIRIKKEIDDKKVKVIVEDNDKGIEEDIKDDLFEPGVKSGYESGTGMGLYIVKNIVKTYGGKVKLNTSQEGGARFDLYLRRID
ncbi:MAG: response regulator [Candidatus Saliniplasma sp.]